MDTELQNVLPWLQSNRTGSLDYSVTEHVAVFTELQNAWPWLLKAAEPVTKVIDNRLHCHGY